MITGMLILFGIIVYLIVGKVIINVLGEYELVDLNDYFDEAFKAIAIMIFPFVVIWVIIRESGNYISDKVINYIRNIK